MKFPRYGYADMVRLQHRLVTEGLGLTQLRLVMGTSMGAMHAWIWGYLYPSFAAGLVPLASNPVEIAGRNRVWRKLLVDAIVTDPTWKNGDYTRATARSGQRARLPADGHERAAAVAEAVPDGEGRRHVAGRSDRVAHQDDRRQRHDLLLPRVGGLRPVAAPGEDHRAAARHQLRRRFRQPARAADDGSAHQEGEERSLRAVADHRQDARPRHAFDSGDLGQALQQFLASLPR